MKRFLVGCLIGVSCFFIGAAAGSLALPEVPNVDQVETPQVIKVGLCDLTQDPLAFDGKVVRIAARYGWVNPTIIGFLHTRDCGKLVRAACPPDQSGCRRLLNLQKGDNEMYRGDVDVIGRFVADDRTPLGNEHRIEIWDVITGQPSGSDTGFVSKRCPVGSH